MITGCFIENYDQSSDAYDLRQRIFIGELSCDPCFLLDSLDLLAYHVVVYDKKLPIGTGRLVLQDQTATIGRIGVIDTHRGQSIGDLIVRMLIDKAFLLGFLNVTVYSRLSATTFYESFGFKSIGPAKQKEGEMVIPMTLTPSTLIKHCKH